VNVALRFLHNDSENQALIDARFGGDLDDGFMDDLVLFFCVPRPEIALWEEMQMLGHCNGLLPLSVVVGEAGGLSLLLE
jgi:hypothetical protein